MSKKDYYVYVYIDPRNFEEFYYGKGRGNRKLAHLKDESDSDKAKIIKKIRKEGLEPIIKVVAANLSESEALLIEKTLIWKLGKLLTNVSGGHFSSRFRPANTLHKNIPGFDYSHGVYYVNLGQGPHRVWNDCRKYGFISAGQNKRFSVPLRTLYPGDIVAAYLKGKGFVGVGRVKKQAVRVNEFKYRGKPLNKHQLECPNIYENSENPEKSEYLLTVTWIKTFSEDEAKFKKNSNIYTTTHIKASLDNQMITVDFINKEFDVNLYELVDPVT